MRRLPPLLSMLLLSCAGDPAAHSSSSADAQSADGSAADTADAQSADQSDAGFLDVADGAGGPRDTTALDTASADATADIFPADTAATCPIAPARTRADFVMPHPAGPGAPARGYDTASPGLVTDRTTGLVWQREISAVTYTQDEALAACACLSLAGHDDWRLPSRLELVSIVDFTRQDPAIDPAAFPDTPIDYFWTSSRLAGEPPDRAYYLAFFDGNTHPREIGSTYRARCVRGGPPPNTAARYQVSDIGTVTDPHAQLTWQRTPDATRRSWAAAKLHCAGLALPGGPWRLPSMKELQTLIDESTNDPAIDAVAFPATDPEAFWTGTPLAGMPDYAWFVSFGNGVAYNSLIEREHLVRCVR